MQYVVQRDLTKAEPEPQPVHVQRSAPVDGAPTTASLGFGWSSLMPMIAFLIVAGAVALMFAHFSGRPAAHATASASANLADERYLPQRQQAHAAWVMAADDPADGAEDSLAYAKQLFAQNCSACHGSSAQGLPRQGANLRTSTFIAQHTDAEMLAFLKSGRQASDPQSLLKLPMPPRGGNPSLTDDRLLDIVQYLRLLQRRSDASDAVPVGQDPSAG